MILPPDEIFRALGDGIRLRILVLLRSLELTVGELALVLGQSQPRMSQHIKALQEAALVERRKEGHAVFLSLAVAPHVQPIFTLLDSWAAAGGEVAWFAADKARLKAIRADRAAEAQRVFERNASRWETLRALHVPDAEVNAAIIAVLGDRTVGRLLDVGTGAGRMLQLLAPRASASLGIDRSPDMLRFARENLAKAEVRAELRQGDMYALDIEDASFDTVVLHQVLHYAHHPEAVIAEVSRLLAPGGIMIVVDIAPHERDEFRSRFGHGRLGFADELILKLLTDNGLSARVEERFEGDLSVVIWSGTRSLKARELRAVK